MLSNNNHHSAKESGGKGNGRVAQKKGGQKRIRGNSAT